MRKAMNLLIDREFIVENVGQPGQIAAEYSRPMIQATMMQTRQVQTR